MSNIVHMGITFNLDNDLDRDCYETLRSLPKGTSKSNFIKNAVVDSTNTDMIMDELREIKALLLSEVPHQNISEQRNKVSKHKRKNTQSPLQPAPRKQPQASEKPQKQPERRPTASQIPSNVTQGKERDIPQTEPEKPDDIIDLNTDTEITSKGMEFMNNFDQLFT